MKIQSRQLYLLVAAAVAATGLVACSNTPIENHGAQAAVDGSKPAQLPATSLRTVASVVVPDHLDAKSAIATSRTVYFGFDEYTLKSADFLVIERHAAYLRSHPQLKVVVEGNTDERGSTEYNLALGQRRSEAVVKALKSQGVKGDQLEAISWGRDKPKASGHDEAAWAQNRRVEIQYPSH
jgi:peptidoglycan-associated lipoprotein